MHSFSLYNVHVDLNCTSISICASFKSGHGKCLSSKAKLILSMHCFSLYNVCGCLNFTSILIRASFKSGSGTQLSSMAKFILSIP